MQGMDEGKKKVWIGFMGTNLRKTLLLAAVPPVLAEPLAQVFQRERWEVASLQRCDAAGVHSYDCGVMDAAAADVMAVRHVDVFVCALLGTAEPAARLERVIALAQAARVGQVILLSGLDAAGAEVRTAGAARGEDAGALLARLEAFALGWKHTEGIPLTILRLPELYGSHLAPEDGVLGTCLAALAAHPLRLPRLRTRGARYFLSAQDAAFGVLRLVERDFAGDIVCLSEESGVTFAAFAASLREALPQSERAALAEVLAVLEKGEGAALSYAMAAPDTAIAAKDLGWTPHAHFPEHLADVCGAVLEERRAAVQQQAAAVRRLHLRARWQRFVPWVENAAGAALLSVLSATFPAGDRWLLSSLSALYIGTMGLLYGKRQAMPAVFVSLCLLVLSELRHGAEAIALLYEPPVLLLMIAYFFIGVLTGYFADRSAHERAAAQWQKRRAAERYAFLKRLFDESIAVKGKLYRQIVNADDSIGRLYRIVRRLDSVEEEDVFTQAALVTSEVLDVENVIVYIVSRDGRYLRQKVRLGAQTAQKPRSLRVDRHPFLEELMREQKIYVNRTLADDVPDLAAPVVHGGRTIAVIELYGMDFDQWSFAQQNLLAVTARLIAASLGRAYEWEREAAERKYLPGTRILRAAEFQKVLDSIGHREKLAADYPASLVPILGGTRDAATLDAVLSRVIRAEDFVGEHAGGLYLLLPDVTGATLALVRQRLARAGIETGEGEEVQSS